MGLVDGLEDLTEHAYQLTRFRTGKAQIGRCKFSEAFGKTQTGRHLFFLHHCLPFTFPYLSAFHTFPSPSLPALPQPIVTTPH